MQLTLNLPEIARERPVLDLARFDLIVICSSAGKDSMALLAYVARLIRQQGFAGRVVVLHNDLGITRSGEPVEWPGVQALAREHAATYGFEFVVRSRALGGLWDELLGQRRRWMSHHARWCTSDQKEGPSMTWITRAVGEFWSTLGVPADRPVEVLYCLGLRGEESASRAAQPIAQINERRSSGRRIITRWLPIRDFSVAEVWNEIKEAGLRPHAGYDWGLSRLSCALCVLASLEDLMLAAALRPALAADYRWAEIELGMRFTERLSMGEILSGLAAARLEEARAPHAAAARTTLCALVREHLATTPAARGEGLTASGRKRRPWTPQQLDARAAARTAEIIDAGRRAVVRAARVDVSQAVRAPLVDGGRAEQTAPGVGTTPQRNGQAGERKADPGSGEAGDPAPMDRPGPDGVGPERADPPSGHRGRPQVRRGRDGRVSILCPYGHLITSVSRGEWAGSITEAHVGDPSYTVTCYGATIGRAE
ncbi:phosphoadenosine phosphosulfate reductase family protein [Nonomuraea sp. NPDC050790]|uniref:phosphoadenosine phosphosulfate reductase domain-containing protein n=1 Tax=Nonomuraea sp. NPDC050790 TaxID=3364371 RepID=UPI0037B4D8B9